MIRIVQRIGEFARRKCGLLLAAVWRRLMFRTTFIAVTGSVGKTTCKEMIAAVLGSQFPVLRSRGGSNHFRGVVLTVLRVRPWHRYAVIEVGIDRPGQMKQFARALSPDIAVWTNVARTHTMNMRTLETTAYEKSRLVEGVRAGGFAILNDDNPHIAAYRPPQSIQTLYCGSTARSAVRASRPQGAWPDRFSFTAESEDTQVDVHTLLVGTHWAPSVLPALVIAKIAGIPWTQATAAIAKCQPLERRLNPTSLPNGATILRDENGSVDTLPAALRVLEEAKASRRIFVFTDVSDSKRKPRERLRDIARQVARFTDAVIFIGDHSPHGANAAIAAGMPPERVWNFWGIQDAADHLRGMLADGDLVLIRGRNVDHLARITHSMLQDVTCWRTVCHRRIACSACPELSRPRAASRN